MKNIHTETLNNNDILYLPDDLRYHNFDNKYVIISPKTANWIVLNENEFSCFLLIKNKEKIFNIVKNFDASQKNIFKKIMGKILARKFAGINNIPKICFPKNNSAYFSITHHCNLRCPHCYIAAGVKNKNELTAQQWIKIAEEFVLTGGTSVTITGGEPLLKKGWLDIIKENHKLKLQQTLLTNGTLWTKNDIEQSAKYIDEVQISLDGINEYTNAPVRGAGNFKRALATIKEFARTGVRTSVAMTPLPNMLRDFSNGFMEFISQHIYGTKIKIRLSQKILPLRNGEMLSNKEQEFYRSEMIKLSHQIYPHSEEESFALAHRPNIGLKNCGIGGITIDSCGFVHPCNRLSEFTQFYNCINTPISQILKQLEQWASIFSVDKLEDCKICDFRYICGGGCRLDEHFIVHAGQPISFHDSYNKLNISAKRKTICTDTEKERLLRKMAKTSEYLYGQ